jgi:hypothetical protein
MNTPSDGKLRAWLQFFRIGGVGSALSGSSWGYLVSGASEFSWWGICPVLLVSFCLYLFGMSLNDLVDLEKDRGLRSGRPLPSGRLGEGEAKTACALTLLIGLFSIFMFLERSQVYCFMMAFALVASYNLWAKHSKVVGPLTVAFARSLNVLGGMVLLDVNNEILTLGLIHFFHTVSIFRVAEGEDRERALGWNEAFFMGLAPVLMFFFEPLGAVLWGACLLWMSHPYRGIQARSSMARLVGGMVGAFTLMEACYLLGAGFILPSMVFLLLFLLGKKLQRAFPAG